MKTQLKNLVSAIGIFSTITLIYLVLSSFGNPSTVSNSGYVYMPVNTNGGLILIKYNPTTGDVWSKRSI